MNSSEKEALEIQSTSETALVRAIKCSDGQAFSGLCEIYYENLYGFIWRKCQNHEATEDLLQQLFLNVWKNRHNLDEKRSMKAYLYKAAMNLTINHLNQSAIRKKYLCYDFDEQTAPGSDHELHFRECLEEALHGLPVTHRTVFMLNRFEGLKYREIAAILSISVKTVEKYMSATLATLRERLSDVL